MCVPLLTRLSDTLSSLCPDDVESEDLNGIIGSIWKYLEMVRREAEEEDQISGCQMCERDMPVTK